MLRRSIVKNRKLNRLSNFNYSKSGYYFVTVCTKNKIDFFGKIKNNKIVLSKIGEMANHYWQKIPEHFSDVKLDEYIMMPNHVHGIIIIESVGNRHACSLQRRQSQKIPTIIGSFKSAVSKCVNENFNYNNFNWQKSYYDHIIRNNESLNKIRKYIIYNPIKWLEDKNDVENFKKINN